MFGLFEDGAIEELIERTARVSLVEVKCPTPFVADRQLSSHGRQKFTYRAAKPHTKIPVYYVPQLMGQMLCTGVHSYVMIA